MQTPPAYLVKMNLLSKIHPQHNSLNAACIEGHEFYNLDGQMCVFLGPEFKPQHTVYIHTLVDHLIFVGKPTDFLTLICVVNLSPLHETPKLFCCIADDCANKNFEL